MVVVPDLHLTKSRRAVWHDHHRDTGVVCYFLAAEFDRRGAGCSIVSSVAMLQFFGILTALDCTDDLWSIGALGVMVGVVLGAGVSYLVRRLVT